MRRGLTAGAFDLLHAGHILMLQEAHSACDYLIVGLQTDPSLDREHKNKPVQSLDERLIQLRAVKYVDEVVIYETEADLQHLTETLDLDVRIIGLDHYGENWTGKEWCEQNGIHIYYNSRAHGFSSTELRQRVKGNASK